MRGVLRRDARALERLRDAGILLRADQDLANRAFVQAEPTRDLAFVADLLVEIDHLLLMRRHFAQPTSIWAMR